VLYEDHSILVVNKPGNLPCHPAGKFFQHTLWAELQRQQGLLPPLHFVNRLDREISGLVVVAKTIAAARCCRAQIAFRPLAGAVRGLTLAAIRPQTGRRHQIRAVLAALGYPLAGDKLYGVDETMFLRFCRRSLSAADQAALRLPRQALHAVRLKFRHPVSAAMLSFEAEMPADMRRLLAPAAPLATRNRVVTAVSAGSLQDRH
jgi:23S rRNA pseudouridine955/2504/2580 synthase/23S rRNA pseudouridine1911/1915/1917 synthase